MALSIQKNGSIVHALLLAYNKSRKQAVLDGNTLFHYDLTANTSDGDYTAPSQTAISITHGVPAALADRIAAAEQQRLVLLQHMGDAFSSADPLKAGAHAQADTVNIALISLETIPKLTATSVLADVQTLENANKAAYNAHCSQASVHVKNDATNTVATADASDQATTDALLAGMKTKVNLHLASAPAAAPLVSLI